MPRKWIAKYGLAAVVAAVLIIAVALFANPNFVSDVAGKASFAVLLTDPPNVPAGTTQLNITYSDLSLHVTYDNGTAEWLSVESSGTVNSFALVNMTQTIASTTIPFNSTVDKIQFTISNVKAEINGTDYDVTTLSNTLVLQVANSQVNQSLSGVLIDLNPTLVQIQAVDSDGNPVSYYVLVPSATAVVVNNLDRAQIRVGTIVKIGENNRVKIANVVQSLSEDISITSGSLSVNGNVTSLSVTLQNSGDVTFRIFGVTLKGEFNTPFNQPDFQMPGNGYRYGVKFNIEALPFRINGTDLVPPFAAFTPMQQTIPQNNDDTTIVGTSFNVNSMRPFLNPMQKFGMAPRYQPMNPINGIFDGKTPDASAAYLVLQPGQSVTLSFTGVIAFPNIPAVLQESSSAITPIVGNSYTIQLTGEGFQSYTVTATT
jgi:hypothetical protein